MVYLLYLPPCDHQPRLRTEFILRIALCCLPQPKMHSLILRQIWEIAFFRPAAEI